MNLALFGAGGKVGRALVPALEAAGHEVRGIGRGDPVDVAGLDAGIDFTRPDAAFDNVRACLEAGVPAVVGTTGIADEQLSASGVGPDEDRFRNAVERANASLVARAAA